LGSQWIFPFVKFLLKKPTLGNNFFFKENLFPTPLPPSLQTQKKEITLKSYFGGKKKSSGPSKGRAIFFF